MKSAGFVSAMNLTGQNTNPTMFLLQNKIRTLTALSNKEEKNILFYLYIIFIYLAIDSNVQYVEQGKN
jgi:hypothetical protein